MHTLACSLSLSLCVCVCVCICVCAKQSSSVFVHSLALSRPMSLRLFSILAQHSSQQLELVLFTSPAHTKPNMKVFLLPLLLVIFPFVQFYNNLILYSVVYQPFPHSDGVHQKQNKKQQKRKQTTKGDQFRVNRNVYINTRICSHQFFFFIFCCVLSSVLLLFFFFLGKNSSDAGQVCQCHCGLMLLLCFRPTDKQNWSVKFVLPKFLLKLTEKHKSVSSVFTTAPRNINFYQRIWSNFFTESFFFSRLDRSNATNQALE